MKRSSLTNVILFLAIVIGIPYFAYEVIPALFPPPNIEIPRPKKEGTYDIDGTYVNPERDEQEMHKLSKHSKPFWQLMQEDLLYIF